MKTAICVEVECGSVGNGKKESSGGLGLCVDKRPVFFCVDEGRSAPPSRIMLCFRVDGFTFRYPISFFFRSNFAKRAGLATIRLTDDHLNCIARTMPKTVNVTGDESKGYAVSLEDLQKWFGDACRESS